MAFAITKDWLDDGETGSEVGTVGPSTTKLNHAEIVKQGKKFRLKDGDGELYFEGAYLPDNPADDDEFEPLDCLGEAYGATTIEYWDKGWKAL